MSAQPGADAAIDTAADTGTGRLEARHLQKSYGKRQVVKDVSLAVRTGEVVGRFAPNLTPDDPIVVGAIEAQLAG